MQGTPERGKEYRGLNEDVKKAEKRIEETKHGGWRYNDISISNEAEGKVGCNGTCYSGILPCDN